VRASIESLEVCGGCELLICGAEAHKYAEARGDGARVGDVCADGERKDACEGGALFNGEMVAADCANVRGDAACIAGEGCNEACEDDELLDGEVEAHKGEEARGDSACFSGVCTGDKLRDACGDADANKCAVVTVAIGVWAGAVCRDACGDKCETADLYEYAEFVRVAGV
jgi:hypothetical protein